jgi:hypothetical protein
MHELRTEPDALCLADSQGRPMAKLQEDGPFLTIMPLQPGGHVLDAWASTLTLDDVAAIRDWCDRVLEGAPA